MERDGGVRTERVEREVLSERESREEVYFSVFNF